MHITDADIQKLARKLVETFSWQDPRQRGFERYWPLAGPLQSFFAHAVGTLEQEVAKALLTALEAALKKMAPHSFHMEADTVATFLDAAPLPPRPRKPHHRSLRRR